MSRKRSYEEKLDFKNKEKKKNKELKDADGCQSKRSLTYELNLLNRGHEKTDTFVCIQILRHKSVFLH